MDIRIVVERIGMVGKRQEIQIIHLGSVVKGLLHRTGTVGKIGMRMELAEIQRVITQIHRRFVGKGHNCVVSKKDPTNHGEIMAIHDACKNLDTFDLSGCTLYTTSAPCPMCSAAIMWANIEKVYYGCTIKDAESIGFRDSDFFAVLKGEKEGIETLETGRKECLELFKEYDNMDKTMY